MTAAAATLVARGAMSPRLRRRLRAGLLAVTVIVVLAIAVLPTRQYLAQRATIADQRATLERLVADNDRLEARAEALRTPAEVERLARAEFGLVYPGEESYAVLPPPETVGRVPSVWPFER